jgi:DnaJ-domain-containing protein 1
VTQEQTKTQSTSRTIPAQTKIVNSYYGILGLHPSASAIAIRQAYRDLSKRYHPDTTTLPQEVAKTKFQQLNEAYGTLSNPEKRSLYDLKIGYSRWNVIQSPSDLQQPNTTESKKWSNSAYLDPSDRPLSSGEIFALLMMGVTLVGCLILVVAIAFMRGDAIFPQSALPHGFTSLGARY